MAGRPGRYRSIDSAAMAAIAPSRTIRRPPCWSSALPWSCSPDGGRSCMCPRIPSLAARTSERRLDREAAGSIMLVGKAGLRRRFACTFDGCRDCPASSYDWRCEGWRATRSSGCRWLPSGMGRGTRVWRSRCAPARAHRAPAVAPEDGGLRRWFASARHWTARRCLRSTCPSACRRQPVYAPATARRGGSSAADGCACFPLRIESSSRSRSRRLERSFSRVGDRSERRATTRS